MEGVQSYYAALADIGSLVAHAPDLADLYQRACELVAQHTVSSAVYIGTVDRDAGHAARVVGVAGPAGDHLAALEPSRDGGPAGGNGMFGLVYRQGASLVSNDCLNDPRFHHLRGAFARWEIRAAVGTPIIIDSECRAILVVATGRSGHYQAPLVRLLERIGEVLAVGVDRAEGRVRSARYQKLYSVQARVNAVVARYPEPQELYEETCRIVSDTADRLLAYIAVAEPEFQRLRIVACAGKALDDGLAQALTATPLPIRSEDSVGQGIAVSTFLARRTVLWPEVMAEAGTSPSADVCRRTRTRSALGIPVLLDADCVAVAVFAAPDPDYFDDVLIRTGEQIASSLGIALKAHEQRRALQAMALTDALTGLPNRTLYFDRLQTAMARVDREGGRVALALIDLDNFKEVNTRFGHSAGDALIREIAARLATSLRRSDTLARLGGDEFVALLPMQRPSASLDGALSRLLDSLVAPFQVSGEQVAVRASIGVAIYPDDAPGAEDLLRRADLAMFRVKSAGGNGWGPFERAIEEQLWRQHQLKAQFVDALGREEIVFHYQPIVELRSGRVVGAEALVRWDDPERGLLAPGEWITGVENDPQLIARLGRRALATAMLQLRAWHGRGERLSLSVNVGVRHLLSGEFLTDLEDALANAPRLAPYLVLEVTETALIDDFRKVARILSECRGLGVRVALDDFGTGQASLTYLLELPADRLKIDHSFVLRMLSDFRAFGIVAAAAQGTRMLGMNAVAEGVETEEHGLRLLQMGCRYAQGFAIARPMPAATFARWRTGWEPPPTWRKPPERPLTQEYIQLLASLVLHRARHWAMLGTVREIREPRRALSPEVWNSYCPLMLESRHAGADLRGAGLSGLHRQLHRLERLCRNQIDGPGELSRRLLTRARQTLQQYEFGVDKLLSGQHRGSG